VVGVEEKSVLDRVLMAPWTIDHESVWEAILADIADIVPVIGELAGIVRIAQAYERKDYLRLALETGDLFAGFPPLIGDILDLITPTNLICYLAKKRGPGERG
jgi:hypothetical protein